MVQEHDPANNLPCGSDPQNVEVKKPAPSEFVFNAFAKRLQDIGTSGQPKLRFSLNLPAEASQGEQPDPSVS